MKEIGGSKTISETNFLVFLAVIEHKATQIINTFKELSNSNMISAPVKPAPMQGGMFNFEDFEDNEEYDKWLSIEELQKKAKEFIMKEQNQKGKKKEVRMKKKWKALNVWYKVFWFFLLLKLIQEFHW